MAFSVDMSSDPDSSFITKASLPPSFAAEELFDNANPGDHYCLKSIIMYKNQNHYFTFIRFEDGWYEAYDMK